MNTTEMTGYRVGLSENGFPLIGKGTQGKRAARTFAHLHYAATGDMVRAYINGPHADAGVVKALVASDKLVDDNKMMQIFREYRMLEFTKSAKPFFLIDGLPRTYAQMEQLPGVIPVGGLVYFHLDKIPEKTQNEILIRRLHERRASAIEQSIKPRDDDTEEILLGRLKIYRDENPRIIDYCDRNGIDIIRVDASGTKDQVAHQFDLGLNKFLNKYTVEKRGELYSALPKTVLHLGDSRYHF